MKRTIAVLAVAAGVAIPSAAVAGGNGSGGNGNVGGRPFHVTLTPEQETAPFMGIAGASGHAELRINVGQGRVCADFEISGFDPALAHIHEAPRGANGGVVVDLTPALDDEDGYTCVSADKDVLKEIVKDPSEYYVNVHDDVPMTAGFFMAIRGQLR